MSEPFTQALMLKMRLALSTADEEWEQLQQEAALALFILDSSESETDEVDWLKRLGLDPLGRKIRAD
eukprot:5682354-Pleurochrysis_carterae.AAC.1